MYTYKPEGKGVPIKSWVPAHLYKADQGMVDQMENVSRLPIVFHHVALSPDGHQGYGVPIGAIVATEGAVICGAVGVDIGCGVCSLRTQIQEQPTRQQVSDICEEIRKSVPVGMNWHQDPLELGDYLDAGHKGIRVKVVEENLEKAGYQLGTLGGGNHFIELQMGDRGYLCAMVHSGSRNIGYKIANHYMDVARNYASMFQSNIPDMDLAFLPQGCREYQEYMDSMDFALVFAEASRGLIMSRVMTSMATVLGRQVDGSNTEQLDVHHNYARLEHHFGRNVMVHRKGATSARKGELGIIPGSMGTCSYIVRGLGNVDSFQSCSHGAGRVMGRKEAQRSLDLVKEQGLLDSKGIVHRVVSVEDLDEATSAYKNIDEVMENQRDLVEIVEKLTPLGVVKG